MSSMLESFRPLSFMVILRITPASTLKQRTARIISHSHLYSVLDFQPVDFLKYLIAVPSICSLSSLYSARACSTSGAKIDSPASAAESIPPREFSKRNISSVNSEALYMYL